VALPRQDAACGPRSSVPLQSAAVSGDRFRLEVQERGRLGSPESRRLRRQGLVPGVLYGNGSPRAFVVEERALRAALTTDSGLHAVLDVVLAGQEGTHPSILKEYQRHPIRGHVAHVDLQEVRLDRPIHAVVQIHLVGAEDAPGVREGGVLSQPSTTVNVEALPMEVPESIDVDVSAMEMGDTLRLEDIAAPEGATLLDDPHDTVIATVTAPTREVEPDETAEEAAEGEGGAPDAEQAPEGGADETAGGDAAGGSGTVAG
jgi:large subunit ribosomal protein L25